MTLMESIRNILTLAGLGSVYIIDSPDDGNTVVLMPYSSDTIGDLPISRVSFQVRMAGTTYREAELLSDSVFDALHDATPTAVTGRTVIGAIVALQEPFFLEKDHCGRYIFVLNAKVSVTWKGE